MSASTNWPSIWQRRRQSFWEAGAAAIDAIAAIAGKTQADCGISLDPGYLHASMQDEDAKERQELEKDAELARAFGFDATFVERPPFANRPGVRFAHQAKFHPLKYLEPLVSAIPGDGSFVFEHTAMEDVDDKPMVVHAGGRKMRCDYLVIATHNPLMGKKGVVDRDTLPGVGLYTSYVLGARVPKGTVPEALFWDTSEPYYYLRVDPHTDHDYVIFGGADVKTGQEDDANQVFQRLAERLRSVLPMATMQLWMGVVVETDDGLPFIGENAHQEFIATGFCGNGFTLGTLSDDGAGSVLTGRIRGSTCSASIGGPSTVASGGM